MPEQNNRPAFYWSSLRKAKLESLCKAGVDPATIATRMETTEEIICQAIGRFNFRPAFKLERDPEQLQEAESAPAAETQKPEPYPESLPEPVADSQAPSQPIETINMRIRQVRCDRDLNQIAFAKRLGVTNAHISAIEKGITTPSQALIKLICKEYRICERWIVTGDGPDEENKSEPPPPFSLTELHELQKLVTHANILLHRTKQLLIENRGLEGFMAFGQQALVLQNAQLLLCKLPPYTDASLNERRGEREHGVGDPEGTHH